MDKLIIKKTEETPAIILNPTKEKFQIVATSWPENAAKFYQPVFNWLEKYFNNQPLDKTIFEFRLIYFNTSSAKQIAKLLSFFKEKSKTHNIHIQWYYEKDDIDMLNESKRYSSLLNMKFETIEKN